MGTVSKLLTGTGLLILAYLILTNYRGATSIVNALGGTYVNGVRALQGN